MLGRPWDAVRADDALVKQRRDRKRSVSEAARQKAKRVEREREGDEGVVTLVRVPGSV